MVQSVPIGRYTVKMLQGIITQGFAGAEMQIEKQGISSFEKLSTP